MHAPPSSHRCSFGPAPHHHPRNRAKGIFEDDKDRDDFLERLSGLLKETMTPCYAWVLMTNHVHLLLRTGAVPTCPPWPIRFGAEGSFLSLAHISSRHEILRARQAGCLDHAPSVNRLCGEVQQKTSAIRASFSKSIQIDSLRRGSISEATGGLHSSQPGQGRNGGGRFCVAGVPFCRAQCLDGEDVSSLAGYSQTRGVVLI